MKNVYSRLCLHSALFRGRSRAVRVLLSEGTLLALGFGQLTGCDGQMSKQVVFDTMTEAAITLLAERFTPQWQVAAVIADHVRKQTNISNSARGLNFQLLIAASLFEYEGTVADLANDVAAEAQLQVEVSAWCYDSSLQATNFTSFDNSPDVRKFFDNPEQATGTICETDNKHRADGLMIGQPLPYELAYSSKLWAEPLSGDKRSDDLSSTVVDKAYLQCPSNSAPQDLDVEKPQESLESARKLWDNTVYPKIFALTEGRRLRLHVNSSGYAKYSTKTLQNEYDVGIGDDGHLQKVYVDPMKGEVRIIIDRENYYMLFKSDVAREAIRIIIENNDKHLEAKRKQQRAAAAERKAKRK